MRSRTSSTRAAIRFGFVFRFERVQFSFRRRLQRFRFVYFSFRRFQFLLSRAVRVGDFFVLNEGVVIGFRLLASLSCGGKLSIERGKRLQFNFQFFKLRMNIGGL